MTEQEKKLLVDSLNNERYALNQLKYKEMEIALLKKKLSLYENRWHKLMNLLLVKVLRYALRYIKGLK
ncbi:hypothetical protein [Macrococcoides caseolyticum]|uniref:Uncharacterized protein n=1 Tax=Macrococcoides caseolyticum TaxID=69966 RepID=A0A855GRE3_9STAP|nr:hypothetical protein [Macrococcus caseolyticus]PKE12553.1 hypothetical protein CW685_03310 [Macrococcus caseolyticus]PKE26378.1 hypothetical protein CW686_05315 [Macrococcus caseolyticus]PKE48981.1 hypothetical protein CW677_02190 [Macrococcus caseolyticus]PKE58892.1 hypothetical protein CW673_05435 [Macrococcus caseolyticus]PKE69858.1 hypothetical protein CW662_06935 [Macrococcus caseolyticus]